MDAQTKENLNYLNDFLHAVGFDDQTIENHFARLGKIIFVSVMEKLEPFVSAKEANLPEMKSFKDFYDYYEQYTDKSTIDRVIQEETFKVVSAYLKAISDQLPK